jgi:hypothetical protein
MAVFFATALLAIALAIPISPASAQTTVGDGLVNVAIGNITIARDVNINTAANLVVQACDTLDVDVVAAIIAAVDAGERNKATFCRTDTGRVTVRQNR